MIQTIELFQGNIIFDSFMILLLIYQFSDFLKNAQSKNSSVYPVLVPFFLSELPVIMLWFWSELAMFICLQNPVELYEGLDGVNRIENNGSILPKNVAKNKV